MILLNLEEANCRIEGIWPVPQVAAPEAMLKAFEFVDRRHFPSALTPFVKNWSDDEIEALLAGDDRDAREAWETLFHSMFSANKGAFVAQASVPVYKKSTPSGCSFSWGYYTTKIFVAGSVDDVMSLAAKWAEGQFQEALNAPSEVPA